MYIQQIKNRCNRLLRLLNNDEKEAAQTEIHQIRVALDKIEDELIEKS